MSILQMQSTFHNQIILRIQNGRKIVKKNISNRLETSLHIFFLDKVILDTLVIKCVMDLGSLFISLTRLLFFGLHLDFFLKLSLVA